MIPPRSTPWTPDEDKLLIEAVAACECRFVSLGPHNADARYRRRQDLLEARCEIYVWYAQL